MGLHQLAVATFAERLEPDDLRGPLHRFARIARAQAGLGENAQCADADIGDLAALLLNPRSVVTGQERLPDQCLGQRSGGLCLFRPAGRQRRLGLVGRACRLDDVDPASCGELEAVAAERAREGPGAVDAAVREHGAELAHEDGQGLVPGRRRRVAPQRLRELVPGHRSPLLRHEIGEEKTALPAGEPTLVDHHPVVLGGDTTCQKDLQTSLLVVVLHGVCLDLAALS